MTWKRTSTQVSSGCVGKAFALSAAGVATVRVSLSKPSAISLAFFYIGAQTWYALSHASPLELLLPVASTLPQTAFSPCPVPAIALLGQGGALRPLAPLLLCYQDYPWLHSNRSTLFFCIAYLQGGHLVG